MRDKILVLGGSGFVGRAILAGLAAMPGLEPVCAVHRRAPPAGIAARAVDATDAASLRQALAGMSGAVNAVLGSDRTMRRATANLCAAAAGGQLKRLIHISSMAVYGPATGLVDETATLPHAAAGSSYAASKLACEAIVQALIAAGGDAVILRPGIVHGPGGEQWTGRLCRMLRAGRLGQLGRLGEGYCNLTYAADLGAACAAALITPDAAGDIYNISTPHPPRWNAMLADLAQAIGAPWRPIGQRRLALEAALAYPLAAANIAAARAGLPARILPEPISPALQRLMAQQIRLDHRRADWMLRFARTPDQAALATSAAWFLHARGR
jgi:nucleoside-diphosphate-sugar epimerase